MGRGSVSVPWDVWTYWVEGYLSKVHGYLPQHIAFICIMCMVMAGNCTYCGGHFAIYTNIRSCCITETNIMLSIILQVKKYNLKKLQRYFKIGNLQRYWGFPAGASGKELACQCRRRERCGSLSRDDPLEEGVATHSSILAWRIPRTEEPARLQSTALQRGGHN